MSRAGARDVRRAFVCVLLAGLATDFAAAAKNEPVSILPGGDSRKPISIEADKLDYFEKEGRAVYDGHVIVMQGDTHLTCSKLTIFMDLGNAAPAPASESPSPAGADASSKLKHMDCAGPVKVVSKTQTATSDAGAYDKGRNTVTLTGHVVLAEGRNVTTGERLVYDLNTGQAAVQGGGKRVTGMFLPGGADPSPKKK